MLVHDDWERARAFVPEGDDLVPFGLDEDELTADREDPFAEVELDLARRCQLTRGMEWDERHLTLAFPVLLDDHVQAVVVITSAPPLWRFESMRLRHCVVEVPKVMLSTPPCFT